MNLMKQIYRNIFSMKILFKLLFLTTGVAFFVHLTFFTYITTRANIHERQSFKHGSIGNVHLLSPTLKSKRSLHSPTITNKYKEKNPEKTSTSKSQNIKMTQSPRLKIPLSSKYNGSLQDNRRLLAVLATTWLPEKGKELVHKNVARMWGWWPGILQPIVYTNLSMADESFNQCIQFGWKFLPIQKTKCQGIPVLKDMVTYLMKTLPNSDFYGFVNSDILFDPGLIETFNFVKKHTSTRPVMLIGQRTNINFTKPFDIFSPGEVNQLAKNGKMMKPYAIDYFLTDRSFPWGKLPELVIGRHQYDNYVVQFALKVNALVIDVTRTVRAVHQTTQDGNDAGNQRHHKNCNRIMIKQLPEPFSPYWGFITCAKIFTQKNKSGNITLSTKKLAHYCRHL